MIIPIGKQWEQRCNRYALNKMGVFSGALENISEFVLEQKKVDLVWQDPLNDVISNIYYYV